MPITHTKVSAIADDADASAAGQVLPSDWNAAHTVTTLPITGGTVVASTPTIDATQTWSNVAVTFTGWKLNVTDTNSAAGSFLLDLQLGGASKFNVGKNGAATFAATVTAGAFATTGVGVITNAVYLDSANQDTVLKRSSNGVAEIDNGTTGVFRDLKIRNIVTAPTTVANLTVAATAGNGARAYVTDANLAYIAANIGAPLVGGGANHAPGIVLNGAWVIGG